MKKGEKMSDEQKEKCRQSHLGLKQSDETKEKKRQAVLGHEVSNETREKIRQKNLGYKHTKESKEKMMNAKLENQCAKGCKHSEESRKKRRQIMNRPEIKERIRQANLGENNPNWQGGISFDPYCEKFNPSKKKEVRDKYNNCDYLTGIHRDICNKDKNGKIHELSVHHIDYNKDQGCDEIPWKLIPVSKSHNSMFNKNKPFWEKLILYSLEYDKEYYKENIINIFEVL